MVTLDLKEMEEGIVAECVISYALAEDLNHALIENDDGYDVINLDTKNSIANDSFPERIQDLSADIDPEQERRQIFDDAWRFLRDFFYDPVLNGLDWEQRRQHYLGWVERAATRWDINHILRELVGELEASHTGASFDSYWADNGLLGADFEPAGLGAPRSFFRIRHLAQGAAWDTSYRSPLLKAGVQEGEYISAVNGRSLDQVRSPWQALEESEDDEVHLRIHSSAHDKAGRSVRVSTLNLVEEDRLRYFEWVESRRSFTENESQGTIGYIHIRDTGLEGFSEFFRQLRAQHNRAALILDARFNGGGPQFLPILRRIRQRSLFELDLRYGASGDQPWISHQGPKVMLINSWTRSGGELLAYGFRKLGLGKLVGTRTHGSTIGANGSPLLVDGEYIIAANLPNRDFGGTLVGENEGIRPDPPEVPLKLLRFEPNFGSPYLDNQLLEAIQHLRRELRLRQPPGSQKQPLRETPNAL